MEHVVLGRTGLSVSVAGLGCGGQSALGQRQGATQAASIAVVREALALGITYVDTARMYGTEDIVGAALAGHRDEVVLSTKSQIRMQGAGRRDDGPLLDRLALRDAVEDSLRRLRTETIDVFHLHGVAESDYRYCLAELVPELERLRATGAIRYLAISERFGSDLTHEMLQLAADDAVWDVVMVGFNLLNQSARHLVLPATLAANVGVEVMFAVRTLLSRPDELRRAVAGVIADGLVDGALVDADDPLGFLVHEGGASSVVEAAYRYARHEPGCHVVLTGTGNVEHLAQNVRSISLGPLPAADRERLASAFGQLVALSGN